MTPSTTPLVLEVKGNQYTTSRITVGDLMKIEQIKARLSNNQYGAILANRTRWAMYTLDNIDMFSHLTVFFPKLIQELSVTSWEDLDPFDLNELTAIYKEQFVPWFSQIEQLLNPTEKSNDEQPNTDSNKDSSS